MIIRRRRNVVEETNDDADVNVEVHKVDDNEKGNVVTMK